MGRIFRTKITVKENLWLTIKQLISEFQTLKEGVCSLHSMNWTKKGKDSGSIIYQINTLDPENYYIRLIYTNTNNWTGRKNNMDYEIKLVKKQSNYQITKVLDGIFSVR